MSAPSSPDLDFDTPALRRHRSIRALKDKIADWGIAIGGVSVIGAVLLIFFYLLYEVAPLFVPAEIKQINQYEAPALTEADSSKTLLLTMEEQAEVGLRVQSSGDMTFFNVATGDIIETEAFAGESAISAFATESNASRKLVFATESGDILIAKHNYRTTYPNDKRLITPWVEYPYGEEAINLFEDGSAIEQISARDGEEQMIVAAVSRNKELKVIRFVKEEDFMSEEMTLEPEDVSIPSLPGKINKTLIDQSQRWMFVLADNRLLHVVDLEDETLNTTITLDDKAGEVTEVEFLLGEQSLLIGTSQGSISQWFMIRDGSDWELKRIRDFELAESSVIHVETEHRRKGFIVAGEDGYLGIYHSTASRTLVDEKLLNQGFVTMGISPRGKDLLIEDAAGRISHWKIDNEHPEVSFASLWDEVWYEGYEEPSYTWQSSASSNDFEPKYSLVPLVFGTIKGAFYAMLLAAPLAICGAIYTAYFMSPAMRRKVKPIIELMEALPTVILGFLAGLALAPFVENNLTGIFAVFVILPISMLAFGFTWVNLPASIRHKVPDGWDAALLIPVILLACWFALEVAVPVENVFFNGSMSEWVSNDLGIDFSQRNALIVGLAMGFAVIPTIFSIAEDAIFSVPKSLSYGSLALGATPWQTMVKVVLPTASPGIFSALMIGLGRAVGETMIVLMATGNTPITDINIFEGMRTLAANIAVEIPESEVGSSHYRILFLTGFVLFLFTFVFNTAAETVRQRLRAKYGQL